MPWRPGRRAPTRPGSVWRAGSSSRRTRSTARVPVNRFWQMLFGAGLVRTPEDFGVQGEPATHPELLDWLAVEFMDSGWDMKHIIRLIVTSAVVPPASRSVARRYRRGTRTIGYWPAGARFRLPSWMIRDAALAASGLLNRALGGPAGSSLPARRRLGR